MTESIESAHFKFVLVAGLAMLAGGCGLKFGAGDCSDIEARRPRCKTDTSSDTNCACNCDARAKADPTSPCNHPSLPVTPNPLCPYRVTNPPRVTISEPLFHVPQYPNSDELITFEWTYHNAMIGRMETPATLGIPIPKFQASQPQGPFGVAGPFDVPWPVLEGCGGQVMNLTLPEGLPSESEEGTTWAAQVYNLPLSAGDVSNEILVHWFPQR